MPGQTPSEGASDNSAKSKAKKGKDPSSNGAAKDQRTKPVPKDDSETESECNGKENASITVGKRKLPEQAAEASKPASAKIVKVVEQPQTPAQDQPTEVGNMRAEGLQIPITKGISDSSRFPSPFPLTTFFFNVYIFKKIKSRHHPSYPSGKQPFSAKKKWQRLVTPPTSLRCLLAFAWVSVKCL